MTGLFSPRLALLLVLPFAIVGCAGHGFSLPIQPASSAAGAKTTVYIHWAMRSRSVNGPASALSAAVFLQNPALTNTLAQMSVDRATAPAAYTGNYTTSNVIKPGPYVLSVVFHSSTGSTGNVVATAVASVVVTSAGQLTNPNGQALNVNAASNLASVSILPNQVVGVGQTTTLAVSAADKEGNIFPLTPGSVFLQIVAGTADVKLQSNGDLTGVAPGTATITATVDGIVSPQATVSVQPPSIAPRLLSQATNCLVLNPVSGLLYASVPSTAQAHGNNVIEIDPATGKVTRSVFVGSEPDALGVSDDGTTLYVALDGSSSIRPIVTSTFKAGTAFPITLPTSLTGLDVTELHVQPGNPNVIAITTHDRSDSGNNGPTIYDHGVARPSYLSIYEGQSLVWASSSLIYALDNTDSGFTLEKTSVDAKGAHLISGLEGRFSGYGTVIKLFGADIYGSDGSIVAANTGSLVGRFSGVGSDVTVDTKASHAVIASGSFSSPQANFNVFSTSQFVPVTSFTVPSVFNPNDFSDAVSGLTRYGAHGLAFRTSLGVFFIDTAPGF